MRGCMWKVSMLAGFWMAETGDQSPQGDTMHTFVPLCFQQGLSHRSDAHGAVGGLWTAAEEATPARR